jgi:hypothetical protein
LAPFLTFIRPATVMRFRMRRSTLAVLSILATACADAPTLPTAAPAVARARVEAAGAPAALIYGLTADNALVSFVAGKPNRTIATVAVTGLQAGERLVGIDFRPSSSAAAVPGTIGKLYGVGSASRIYTIDPITGVATYVSTLALTPGGPAIPLQGSSFGVGFNPVPDRLRIHSDADQNLRVNVDNGVTIVDGTLGYTDGSGNPAFAGTGYTNNDNDPLTGTVLYAIDSERDALALVGNPNGGTATVVGPLGVDTDAAVGFDIALPGNVAYAALSESASGKSTLYTIDLTSGAATKLGLLAQTRAALIGIAVQP